MLILLRYRILDRGEYLIVMIRDFPHMPEFSLYCQAISVILRPFISDFPVRHRDISLAPAYGTLDIIPAWLCYQKAVMASRTGLFFWRFSKIPLRSVDFWVFDGIGKVLSQIPGPLHVILSCKGLSGVSYGRYIHVIYDIDLSGERDRI